MIIPIEIPDSVATQLHLDGANGKRRALEMLALEGYRIGELSEAQVGKLLNLSFYELETFLKENNAPAAIGIEEHMVGLQNLQNAIG